MQLKLDGRNRHFKEALQGSTARKHCLQRRTETTTTTFRTFSNWIFSNWMAKIRAESLLRRPLRGISTCLTAATVRSTSTTELPTRKIASPQSYTENSFAAELHGSKATRHRSSTCLQAPCAGSSSGFSPKRCWILGSGRPLGSPRRRPDRPRGPTERAVTRGGGIGGSPWKYPRRRRFRF